MTERAENKLKALRQALHHCKEVKEKLMRHGHHQHDGSGDKENNNKDTKASVENLEDRIQRYRQEMRRTRMERNQSWRDDKTCLSNVLDAWKALKGLRSHQGNFLIDKQRQTNNKTTITTSYP